MYRLSRLARIASRRPSFPIPTSVLQTPRLTQASPQTLVIFRSFSTRREDKAQAKRVFNMIDTQNENGWIETNEFIDFVKMPTLYNKKDEAHKASRSAAKLAMSQVGDDNHISFDQFYNWWKGNVTVVGIPASIQENMKKLGKK
ncbi:hypothetical protein AAMO2058_000501200 [Amorphochlora amoebiformis]